MKKRDFILIGTPLLALVVIVLLTILLGWRVSKFEDGCRREAMENVAQETVVVADVIRGMLERDALDEALKYCDSFHENTLRVTLMNIDGTVAADSAEDIAFLGNHLNREEVRVALAGQPHTVLRFSDSLGEWMIYHAVAIKCKSGTYILRTAVSTDSLDHTLKNFRLIIFGTFGLALIFACVILVYIIRKVRKPLEQLQVSVREIAAGHLDTPIAIPPDGVMRELAQGVDAMTNQLRERLDQVTADRNEREMLFSSMNECVILLDAAGTMIRANRAALQFFGIAGSQFNINRCQIAPLVELVNQAFNSLQPFEQEVIMQSTNGEMTLLARGQFLMSDGIELLLLTITDLSALRQLETFRSDFIANVSHEIKTPLTCIVGAAEAIEECHDDEQRKKLIDMLKRHSERLNQLVHDILDLTAIERLQRDTSHRDFTHIQVDSLLADVINLSLERANAAGMKLELHGDHVLTVNGDYNLLEQAILNLVSNAVKYSEGHNITIGAEQKDHNVVISVRDDGVGIPFECQERLFERFYRVDKSRSRKLGGTGLGLAIVKHTAQLHGGRAEVQSVPGHGAIFSLILPLA
jgi:two-component system, OmpR family, phosphate regulon sensor histidine kinase PhoR